ncbi:MULTISPECIES: aldo/keto reductase [unclassified Lentimonas]|uniref:aldo/keto reductase n=1 Tax=unclassified Lentimonas TaxID=2630993 RepID=UPI00132AF08F|nr:MULTISPECIES: aldo/keto reductase [unclassified Lentimonas]CAA6677590.1 Unannotated [Lentimonas sp. CC4]CAA6684312.1 Unannotated [Lentimonas sp. CC6]CAA7078169.1 Unannotated [Lentimonas sp. CC4]CAA7168313.1 Unannotated [Lentimonas sp. CC21]CAA7181854.1 Unannotated [Lentimonas sp. CC8]
MSISRRHFLKASVGSAALASSPAAMAQVVAGSKVQKRKFGRHDDLVSVVGIGGHTLYLSGSQDDANEICAKAIDHGINFFDNAWCYHDNEAEVYMGNALKGKRDKAFLMTKLCPYHIGKRDLVPTLAGSMKGIEDSLRRLKTDHLDLLMMHQVSHDDVKDAYRNEGAIEALELAKQQGKIRYAGFTGHSDPKIHIEMIEQGYEWDAMLIPISAQNAMNSRAFEKVIPLCGEKGIAVFGMKGFGGSRRTNLHKKTTVEEVLRYSLSYEPVCTQLIGIDRLEFLDKAIVAGSTIQPMSAKERGAYASVNEPTEQNYAELMYGETVYHAGCHQDCSHSRA